MTERWREKIIGKIVILEAQEKGRKGKGKGGEKIEKKKSKNQQENIEKRKGRESEATVQTPP